MKISHRWQGYTSRIPHREPVIIIVLWLNKQISLQSSHPCDKPVASPCAECLEAEFYSFAAFGHGLNRTQRAGGPRAAGGKKALLSPEAQTLARDIAADEITHVEFLHSVLKSVKSDIACPKINIGGAFAAAANAAFGTTLKTPFTPYDIASHSTLT